jgi:hypothetical protein
MSLELIETGGVNSGRDAGTGPRRSYGLTGLHLMAEFMRTLLGAWLVVGVAACGGSGSPASPSPAPQPPAPQPPTAPSLVTFTDPASTFSTTDVRDYQDQIVRFNTADDLIWAADGARFPGYRVTGNFIGSHGYEVVFVTRDGERRAYFTVHGHGPTDPNRVCDIEVVSGRLVITETSVPVCSPQSSGPC